MDKETLNTLDELRQEIIDASKEMTNCISAIENSEKDFELAAHRLRITNNALESFKQNIDKQLIENALRITQHND